MQDTIAHRRSDPSTRALGCPDGVAYLAILQRIMKAAGITRRRLTRDGIISDRGRKTLEQRIVAGTISKGEYDRINAYLRIDPIRLHMAIAVYNDAESYFDQSTAMAASYSHEIGLQFRKNEAARAGNFGPIGANLVRAHAARMSAEFTRHLDQVDRFREAPLG